MSRIIIKAEPEPIGEGDAQEIVSMIEGWIAPYLVEDLGWGEDQILDIRIES
tara:strand:+ start:519 stop:674 length:156 start_codon:yes stop_codon:yes gene_type:complete